MDKIWVARICEECEVQFLEELCWSCGEKGIPAGDTEDKTRFKFTFQNPFTYQARGDDKDG